MAGSSRFGEDERRERRGRETLAGSSNLEHPAARGEGHQLYKLRPCRAGSCNELTTADRRPVESSDSSKNLASGARGTPGIGLRRGEAGRRRGDGGCQVFTDCSVSRGAFLGKLSLLWGFEKVECRSFLNKREENECLELVPSAEWSGQ